jgi:hypothetical protein
VYTATIEPNDPTIQRSNRDADHYTARHHFSGQQHQQFRALGLGQRPFLDASSSFRSHLRELESFGRNKPQHHHSGSSHLHDQQTGNNVTTNSVSGACSNPNNTDPTASPASSTHLGATGGSSAHQDCYKRSPQHGGEF